MISLILCFHQIFFSCSTSRFHIKLNIIQFRLLNYRFRTFSHRINSSFILDSFHCFSISPSQHQLTFAHESKNYLVCCCCLHLGFSCNSIYQASIGKFNFFDILQLRDSNKLLWLVNTEMPILAFLNNFLIVLFANKF